MKALAPPSVRGFTLPELLLALVLGVMIIGGLQRVILSQNAYYREARFAVERHDAMRTALAVLAPELRGANPGEGDAAILGGDTLQVRSGVGFAVVCGVEDRRGHLALVGVEGRIDEGLGDTLLVYHPSGWRILTVSALNPGGRTAACALTPDSVPELRVRVSGEVEGIPVGAPLRAFHSYRYHPVEAEGAMWLGREGLEGTDILAGPLARGSGALAFRFLDAGGAVTDRASEAVRVLLTARMDPGAGRGLEGSVRLDSLSLSLGFRNR